MRSFRAKVAQPFSNRRNNATSEQMSKTSSLAGLAGPVLALGSDKLRVAQLNLLSLVRVDFPGMRGGDASTGAGVSASAGVSAGAGAGSGAAAVGGRRGSAVPGRRRAESVAKRVRGTRR